MRSTFTRRGSRSTRRITGLFVATLAFAAAFIAPGATLVSAATPTGGATSDLQGIASSYTSVLIDGAGGTSADTILFCNGSTATSFVSHISFHLAATASAGSFFRVYL